MVSWFEGSRLGYKGMDGEETTIVLTFFTVATAVRCWGAAETQRGMSNINNAELEAERERLVEQRHEEVDRQPPSSFCTPCSTRTVRD